MMKYTLLFVACLLGLFLANPALAQNKPGNELSAEEIKSYKEKVTELVNYLESTLNSVIRKPYPGKRKLLSAKAI